MLVARIDAVQAEYSAFETIHETDGLVDTARELDISFIAYGPLGHGWLVEDFPYNTPEDFAPEDYRRQSIHPTLLIVQASVADSFSISSQMARRELLRQ